MTKPGLTIEALCVIVIAFVLACIISLAIFGSTHRRDCQDVCSGPYNTRTEEAWIDCILQCEATNGRE